METTGITDSLNDLALRIMEFSAIIRTATHGERRLCAGMARPTSKPVYFGNAPSPSNWVGLRMAVGIY